MSHDLYVQVLSAMFLFWNGARVLTYIPTIGKLLAREADVRSYSLLSWGSWALSNGTFALMLLEMSRGTPNQMFWMNLANTLMCLVVSLIIVLKRFPWVLARVNVVYRRLRRNDSKAVAAFGAAARHVRFGRHVVWATSASALAVAVTGSVVYGVWLNRNQLAHVDATATARPLGVSGPTSPTRQTSWSARITRPSLPSARGTVLARAGLAPSSSAVFHRRTVPSPRAAAPQLAMRRPDQMSHPATQNRGHSASHLIANARPAPAITGPTSPKQQTPSSNRVALSASPPAGATAADGAERAPAVSSAPVQSHAVPRPPVPHPPEPQLAAERPDQAGHFATQIPRRSTPAIAVYDAPPPLVYEAPPPARQTLPAAYGSAPVVYVYAPAPAAYGYAYDGAYWDRRHGHDNGWHKGWRVHHREDDDE